MERQNVTLSVPKEILQKIKHLAVDKRTSVSALLVKALEETVRKDEAFQTAKSRQLALMEQGFDLGIEGKINYNRDDLHER
ncbi:CopG family transcriptional regulator [Metallumcola ferriviriculae]|uniref:CopG family transcriptional regulator n=1 Tax=Metallumcola ferriviriculae TaxID=3039180 RepID=A0AAU0US97_9FIRM|nr:CopG family transcriptional regulator [Desulfitibacteraceae bacterium MK1]